MVTLRQTPPAAREKLSPAQRRIINLLCDRPAREQFVNWSWLTGKTSWSESTLRAELNRAMKVVGAATVSELLQKYSEVTDHVEI